MSYQALARKWRPRTFSQLVGQEHISKALINSLNRQRLHHAYLFTGTRGVGKTSVARLLAKALNCEQGIQAEPCLQCETCLAIEEGRFIDLIEVDAASRTGVEDTRALLENIQYATTSGRFKIYLIDEVHMLSQHSFNALLKTLEEPPEHVKFLLATTDPQKLPATVLSRCLQFHLRHLPDELIAQHLGHILSEENIAYEDEALNILAQAAKGSMRDSLSMLDQAIASSDDKILAQEVKTLLGYTKLDYAIQLLNALSAQDTNSLLEISRKIASEGGHFNYVLDEIIHHLHQMTIYQTLKNTQFITSSATDIQDLAERFSAEDLQLFYQIALKGREEIHLAPTLAIGFEMTVLRMLAFRPATDAVQPPMAWEQDKQAEQATKAAPSTPTEAKVSVQAETPQEPPEASSPPETQKLEEWPVKQDKEKKAASPASPQTEANTWANILPQLNLSGFAQNAAENAEMLSKIDNQVSLRVIKGHLSLFTPSVMGRIETALSDYYQQKIKLALKSDEPVKDSPAQQKQRTIEQNLQNAEEALQQDVVFQEIQDKFSAQVINNSIEPITDDVE